MLAQMKPEDSIWQKLNKTVFYLKDPIMNMENIIPCLFYGK